MSKSELLSVEVIRARHKVLHERKSMWEVECEIERKEFEDDFAELRERCPHLNTDARLVGEAVDGGLGGTESLYRVTCRDCGLVLSNKSVGVKSPW